MTNPVDQWRRIGPAWAEMCWNSTDRPHRALILRALESLAPFDSVLEVGCNAGPNLRLIHERWPKARLGGLDVNAQAVGHLSALPAAAAFIGDVRDLLPDFEASQYDVVLSCYCLAYIEPGQIADVLGDMKRIARIGLVIAEPMRLDAGKVSERIDAGIPEWRHDYLTPLEPFCVLEQSGVEEVSPPVERLNAVLTVRL